LQELLKTFWELSSRGEPVGVTEILKFYMDRNLQQICQPL
jgi:hypothetical protein